MINGVWAEAICLRACWHVGLVVAHVCLPLIPPGSKFYAHFIFLALSISLACSLRKQVLGSRGLTLSDFASEEDAYKAADVLVNVYKDEHPEVVENHPDILFEGLPQLDQFWYAEFKGNQHFGSFAPFGFVCIAVGVHASRAHMHLFLCLPHMSASRHLGFALVVQCGSHVYRQAVRKHSEVACGVRGAFLIRRVGRPRHHHSIGKHA